MIRILVVDDSERKRAAIKNVLEKVPLDESMFVEFATTVYDAGQKLHAEAFDLLVLDLHVPIRAHEDAKPDGGMRLLEHLDLNSGLRRPAHIIGLTAFSDLAATYDQELRRHGVHLILFRDDSNEWASVLGRRLVYIAESKAAVNGDDYQLDLAVICALQTPELEAVLALPASWREERIQRDDAMYHRGRFERDGAALEVVASAAVDMGMPAATALAMKIIYTFRPRYLAIAGIAAGVSGEFGDILIADQSWDYGNGKSYYQYPFGWKWLGLFGHTVFQPAPIPVPISPLMKTKLGYFGMNDGSVLRSIRDRWQGNRSAGPITVRPGPVASGAAVLQNRPLISEIKSHNRKLVGIEMETYGVFVAARLSGHPQPLVVSIKSICDLGDERKGDQWQTYAAYTSAQYLYEFALDQLSHQTGKDAMTRASK